MSYNLTPTSATYNATGKFGASLNGGKASGASPLPTSGAFTVEVWAKGSGANTNVIVGQLNAFWIGHDVPRNVVLHYGSGGTEVTISSAVSLNDTNWHHIEWDYDPATGSKLYVDGALVGSNAATMAAAGATYAGSLEVRSFASGAFTYAGEVDEMAFWTGVQHASTPFSPRTTVIANNSAGLLALYHFDNDTNDSASAVASPATAVTLAGPTSGTVGVASSNFTAGVSPVGGTITGTVVVTPSDGGAGGTFSPTTVSLTAANPTGNFTYTPASTGAKTISVTNNGGLSNPANITYTAASAGDATPPTMNGTLSYSAVTSSGFTLSWVAGSDNVGVTGYEVDDGSGAFVDVGNVLSKTVTGKAPATLYNPRVRDYDAAGLRSSPITTGVTTAAASNNALASGTGNVLFSPYTWNVQGSSAKTIDEGAYFETIFGGTSCTLNFDMTGIATPYPQISYRVDGFGPWITAPIAASVAITIPSETAGYANKPGHFLHVHVKSITETQPKWSTQATAVVLTGIVLDSGKTLTAPTAKPYNDLFFGDSITAGVRTVKLSDASSTSTDQTDSNDAGQSWAFLVGQALGGEFGIVGFGASGFTATGSGGVPPLPTSYNQLYSGVPRSFTSPQPRSIILMEGTNDGGDVTGAATTVLNGLLAATTTTKIIVLRPFNGTAHATQLQAAIAACSTPARVTYVDTAGWFNTANSSDGLHPYGVENLTHIAPLAANAIRAVLSASAPTAPRTFAVSLDSAPSTPAANLTGLKIRCYNMDGSLAGSTDNGTSDASGNVVMPNVQSTASAGASCLMVVRDPTHHWANFVTVS